MKWMVVSVLALGASSEAAAGYVAMQSSREEAAMESDSTQAAAEAPDTTEHPSDSIDSVTAIVEATEVQTPVEEVVSDSTDRQSEENCSAVAGVETTASAAAPEAVAPDPEAQKQAYRQVARILSNMGDSEVAQLLAHIEDDEIEVILRNVTAREGARLLSQMSGERAAALSRRLLVAATDSGSSD